MWRDLGAKGLLEDNDGIEGEVYLGSIGLMSAIFNGGHSRDITTALQTASLSPDSSIRLRVPLSSTSREESRYGTFSERNNF